LVSLAHSNRRFLQGSGLIFGLFLFSTLTVSGFRPLGFAAEPPPKDMVLVPAGPYIMGTDLRLPDEGPKHKVYVTGFFIDKYEVSNKQYLQFVKDTHRIPPIYWKDGLPPAKKIDHPVVFVTWYDGNEFCHWRGKRLPTAIEWEKAARGNDERTYPWGDEFDETKANTPYSQRGDTTPVGSFPTGVSPYGAYDMSGNVWEWTASWYKAYPGNHKRRLETYGERYRVLKGGSYVDCSFYHCGISAPVFNRSFFKPETRNDSFGFRCAKSQ